MRILIVGPVPPPTNGLSIMTMEAAGVLRRLGHNVDVINTSPSERHRSGDVSFGRIFGTLQTLARVRSYLRNHGPVIVYLPAGVSPLGALRDGLLLTRARHAGCPTVIHIHTSYLPDAVSRFPILLQRWVRGRYRTATLALSLTHESARRLPLVGLANVHVVPNFVEVDSSLLTGGTGHGCVFFGNVIEKKGYRQAVMAYADLYEHGQMAIPMDVIGHILDSDWRSWWHGAVQSRPWLEGVVRWPGAAPAAARLNMLKKFGVLVFPTRYHEGVPLVVLEAAALGLAVVTTRAGGIEEVFGQSLFYVEDPLDINEIGIRILEAQDGASRTDQIQNAKRIALAHTRKRFAGSLADALSLATLRK